MARVRDAGYMQALDLVFSKFSLTLGSGIYRQDIIKADKLKRGDTLPPVFPLVLYNGGTAWNAPTALRDLLLPHQKPLAPYQPQQEYCLLDAGRVPEAALAGNHDLATLLIRLERAQKLEDIIRAVCC